MTRHALHLPNGQTTMWRVPAPRESPLVTAILAWSSTAKWNGQLVLEDLARSPAGAWLSARTREDGALFPTGWVRGAPKGWPDLTGWVPAGMPERSGRVVGIEVKRDEHEKPTPEQVARLTRIYRAGGIAIVTWSIDDFEAAYLGCVGLKRGSDGRIGAEV
jgi:hypothetical protein